MSRGQVFWNLQGRSFRQVSANSKSVKTKDHTEIRVIVDRMTYRDMYGGWASSPSRRFPMRPDPGRGYYDNPFEPVGNNYGNHYAPSAADDYSAPYNYQYTPAPPPPPPLPQGQLGNNRRASSYNRRERRPANQENPFEQSDSFSKKCYTKYDNIDPTSQPDDLILMLCPSKVKAFSMRDKTWGKIYHDYLQDVTLNSPQTNTMSAS